MKKITLLTILSLIHPVALMADSPSFDFVELGHTEANFKGKPKNFNGLKGIDLRASYTLNDSFYIAGDFFRVDLKDNAQQLDIFTIGTGYRYSFLDTATFYSEIDGVIYNPEGPGNHEHGGEATAGIRSNSVDNIELNVAVKYLYTKSYDITTFLIGASYKLNRSYAIYSDYRTSSEFKLFSIGVRYSF